MADVTINGLPSGSPTDLDEIEMQTASGGLSFKSTLGAVVTARQALAEAHSNTDFTHSNVTGTAIPLEGYDSSLTSVGVTTTLTPVSTSNTAKFTINSGKDGIYRVTFNIDVASNITESIDFVLYVGNPAVATEFKAGVDFSNAATDAGTSSINTFVDVVSGDEIEMFVSSDGTTFTDLLIDSLTFTCERR